MADEIKKYLDKDGVKHLVSNLNPCYIRVTCDPEFAGLVITATNGNKVVNRTCPNSAPYVVEFAVKEIGEWVISYNAYYAEVTVSNYTIYEVKLKHALPGYESWLAAANISVTMYSSLQDVLADEKAVRELMTRHASVEYLVKWLSRDNENAHIVLNNNICAKWINLRDYALDTLSANQTIKAVMDEVDKYGYGEWGLVNQVPCMASATAPYGEVIGTTELPEIYYPYRAFDRSNNYYATNNFVQGTNGIVGYKFPVPKKIEAFSIKNNFQGSTGTSGCPIRVRLEASNNGTNWTSLGEYVNRRGNAEKTLFYVDNTTEYLYYRIVTLTVETPGLCYIAEIEFLAWCPVSAIPTMTSDTAPYGEVIKSTELASNEAWRAFDDKSDYWQTNTTNGSYIGYKFTCPVILREISLENNASYGVKSFVIQASNDGISWNEITQTINASNARYAVRYKIDNNDSYMYYRLAPKTFYSATAAALVIYNLQFYGRSFNVSVPIMTSNVLPYGNTIFKKENTSQMSFNAFNDTTTVYSTGYLSTALNEYVGYEFTDRVKLKKVFINPTFSSSYTIAGDFALDGTNDKNGEWTQLTTFRTTTNTLMFVDVPEYDGDYKCYRIRSLSADGNYKEGTKGVAVIIPRLQFYGVDYTEREFAEDSTIKYLYDHGIEFEELESQTTSYQITEKNTNHLYVEKTNSTTAYAGFIVANKINVRYKLCRVVIGNRFYYISGANNMLIMLLNTKQLTYVAADAIAYKVFGGEKENLPNNVNFAMPQIDSAYYALQIATNNGKQEGWCEIKEWWLE